MSTPSAAPVAPVAPVPAPTPAPAPAKRALLSMQRATTPDAHTHSTTPRTVLLLSTTALPLCALTISVAGVDVVAGVAARSLLPSLLLSTATESAIRPRPSSIPPTLCLPCAVLRCPACSRLVCTGAAPQGIRAQGIRGRRQEEPIRASPNTAARGAGCGGKSSSISALTCDIWRPCGCPMMARLPQHIFCWTAHCTASSWLHSSRAHSPTARMQAFLSMHSHTDTHAWPCFPPLLSFCFSSHLVSPFLQSSLPDFSGFGFGKPAAPAPAAPTPPAPKPAAPVAAQKAAPPAASSNSSKVRHVAAALPCSWLWKGKGSWGALAATAASGAQQQCFPLLTC